MCFSKLFFCTILRLPSVGRIPNAEHQVQEFNCVRPIGEKIQSQLDLPPNCEVVAISRIDWYIPVLLPVPCGNKRAVKAYVLLPSIYHFGIIRKDQCQYCEGIWEVAYEKEKHGTGLQRIPAQWNDILQNP